MKSAPNSKFHCARLLWKPVLARMERIVIMLTVKRKKESQFLQWPDIRQRYENGELTRCLKSSWIQEFMFFNGILQTN